ncbi:membrane protein insertase YidC [Candidatus Pantoea edessiphila]|uniref:Membrane protein insertase YidC n=1 Tax=Candidatus Pantoea edessiphila TaxID=2044610 RepID=A0A2P5SXB9_9GAMM|nr:membrane protein insertase YidC [Candidatus Pantoea edessiphila]MBK4775835.1 membrane protein insertase YidC [Pantoea sp. Edef]PPI86976.1 membrane protein insertase YidC [Candidatus Pantoea edessiphila]
MDSQRNLLLIVFLLLFIVFWQAWQTDYNLRSEDNQKITNNSNNKNSENSTFNNNNDDKNILIQNKDQNIFVKTDVFLLNISTYGGDICQAELLNFPETIGSNKPLKLLKTSDTFIYQIQTGLNGVDGSDNIDKNIRPKFITQNHYFEMKKGQNELKVPITYLSNNGTKYTKTFIFKRGEYSINVLHNISNFSNKSIKISSFGKIKQSFTLPHNYEANSSFALHNFRGAAYSTDNQKYKKYKFNDIISNNNLNIRTINGWVAMLQQYFATALILDNNNDEITNTIYTNNIGNNTVTIGYLSSPITIPAHTEKDLFSTIWLGPELQDKMALLAPNLDSTVDYGWLWFISKPLFKLLKLIYSFVHNWGFSIIIITCIVRVIMYPLSKAQYVSMARMRTLQPKIQNIRDRLGDDKQKIGQEMIALYRKEKVNPLGGCLPIIIQMPIFLALYYMLSSCVELRQAPFIFWIHDLSSQDPYYILPIIMGSTMFFIQKTSPVNNTDPVHQKFMNYMPMIFTVFFLWFPSGLVIYYIISNLVTLIQQQIIYRSLKKHGIE